MLGSDAQGQSPSLLQCLKEKEFWILFLVGIVYFYRPLFLPEAFFYRDLHTIFFPQKKILVELVRSSGFPLWDPYLHGGEPFLANINNSVFYPSNILYFLLPLHKAFNIDIVCHVILNSLAAYLLARTLGLRQISSFAAGIVYAYSGYSLSHINLFIRLLAMPYLPLIMIFWHRFLIERRFRWFVCVVISGVLQVFSGAMEMVVVTHLFLLLWVLFERSYRFTAVSKILLWIAVVASVVGLTCVQTIPAFEMVRNSSRFEGVGQESFANWSIHPKRLGELVLNGFLGFPDTLDPSDYWGSKIEDQQFPYILSIYFGSLVLLLSAFASFAKRHFPISARSRRFLFFFFLGSLVLSMWRFLPFLDIAYDWVPFLNMFRYPVKFLVGGILPLSLLTACGVETYFAHIGASSNKPFFIASCVVTSFWMVAGLLFSFSENFSFAFQHYFFDQTSPKISNHLEGAFLQAFLTSLALSLICVLMLNRRFIWQPSLAVVLLLADLSLAGIRLNPYAPEQFYSANPPAVAMVKKAIGGGRLYRAPNPENVQLRAPTNRIFWQYRWNVEVLRNPMARAYQIPIIFHSDFYRFERTPLVRLNALIAKLPWQQKIQLLSCGAVQLILTTEDPHVQALRRLGSIPNNSSHQFFLYENMKFVPRIHFVTSVFYVSSDSEAYKVMTSSNFDPARSAVIQGLPVFSGAAGPHFELQDLKESPKSISFSIRHESPGYLVFSEAFYPGWKVYVNQVDSTVVPANGAFSAVFLPEGKQQILRLYRPASLQIGAALSFGSVVLQLLLYLFVFRKSLRLKQG